MKMWHSRSISLLACDRDLGNDHWLQNPACELEHCEVRFQQDTGRTRLVVRFDYGWSVVADLAVSDHQTGFYHRQAGLVFNKYRPTLLLFDSSMPISTIG